MVEYGHEPAVLVVADGEAAAERATGSLRRAGCRVTGVVAVEQALAHLAGEIAMRDLFVEVDGDPGDVFDRLVDRIEAEAATGRRRGIVSAPLAALDAVAARNRHADLIHLCEASEAERMAAIALMTARRPVRLQDVGREEGADRLQQFGEEVRRIANALASLSDEAAPGGSEREASDEDANGPSITPGQVRAVIRARRLRDQYFSRQLFADPAWDMLLDLTAARLERQRVAVSSLCIAAMVPPTTALRWIKTLTDHRLFVRHADPQDGRRVYVELADDTAAAMEAYLRAALRITSTLV